MLALRVRRWAGCLVRITKVEAQALAAFIGRIRPDWNQPGIVAAIEKAGPLGPAAAVGAALCKLAENYELRTPAMLDQPGPHWAGTTVATRTPPTMCPDHPEWRAHRCDADGPCARQIAADHAAGAAAVRRALADAPRPPAPTEPRKQDTK